MPDAGPLGPPWQFENDESRDCEFWRIYDELSDTHDTIALVPKTGDEAWDNDVIYPTVRLITAAPNLLAACEAACQHTFPNLADADDECWRMLRAAIAQAKGNPDG